MGTSVTSPLRFRILGSTSLIASAAFVVILGASLALTGCKQGEGDTCQVDSDCEEGLVCVPGISTCQKSGGGGSVPDAAPRTDADTTDATISDAAIDDAAVDDAAIDDADVADADLSR